MRIMILRCNSGRTNFEVNGQHSLGITLFCQHKHLLCSPLQQRSPNISADSRGPAMVMVNDDADFDDFDEDDFDAPPYSPISGDEDFDLEPDCSEDEHQTLASNSTSDTENSMTDQSLVMDFYIV